MTKKTYLLMLIDNNKINLFKTIKLLVVVLNDKLFIYNFN